MIFPCARLTRYGASELLDPGPQLDFPGPGAAVLSVYVQVVLRDLVGEEHPVRAALARSSIARATRDPAVDDEVRDVDALGRQLPRHALREATQRELSHRERRRFRVAFYARGSAGEENGTRAAGEHALRRALSYEKPRIARHPDRALDLFRVESDEGPAHAVARVVDHELGHAPFRFDRGEHRLDLRRVGGVTRERDRAGFLRERREL